MFILPHHPCQRKRGLSTATHDTSIHFGSFTPHTASTLPTSFSPIKNLPNSDQHIVEEGSPDDHVLEPDPGTREEPDEKQPVVEEGSPDDFPLLPDPRGGETGSPDDNHILVLVSRTEQATTRMLTANDHCPQFSRPHTLTQPTLCAILSQSRCSKMYGLLPENGFTAIPSTILRNTDPKKVLGFRTAYR